MKFSLSLEELYDNMTDEYDTPIEEYMDYKEFVEYIKNMDLRLLKVNTEIT